LVMSIVSKEALTCTVRSCTRKEGEKID
jgi:hypothetical protein